MRNKLFILSVVMLLGIGAAGAQLYNYAWGRVPVGTFTNNKAAVDDSLDSYTVSGRIDQSPQFLTIDLGRKIYVGSVKIYWAADALSKNYSVRVSNDKKKWFTEFSELDASKGVRDPDTNTAAQIVSTSRYVVPSQYLQIYIPMGSSASASQVKIAEIQVLPTQNLVFELEDVRPYVVADKKAIIVYRTSIGAVKGQVLYGRDPNDLNRIAANMESGVINSATLTKLDPKFIYFYKVKAWDAFGNMVESDIRSFRPPRENLALKKKVTGTFTKLPPNDPMVDRTTVIINRAVDGMTGYFKGMATSGSIRGSDQEITIDLGRVHPVSSIVSYWRALAYPESFSIQVSSDKKNWVNVAAKVNAGEGAFARSDAGDPMRVSNIEMEDKEARYIKITINKNSPYFVKHADWDFVQLMEVEVFAE